MELFVSRILHRLKRSDFFKNIFIVMTGTAISQIIGFALSPIISRLYSPLDFGIFGSFNAILGVIAAGVTLEYSQAIMLPPTKEEAINLLALSFYCTLVISFLLSCFSIIKPSALNSIMKTKGSWALGLLIVSTLVMGTNQSLQAWAVRSKAFKQTSASQVIRSISSNGLRICLGLGRVGAQGLIISNFIGIILASSIILRFTIQDVKALRDKISWSRIRHLAINYRDFPIYSASQGIINALSTGMPVLLLSHYYGITTAGSYAFCISVLHVPMGLVLTALRQVLFQKASETSFQGENLSLLYLRSTAILIFIVAIPALVVFFWAPQLFSWIFGPEWLVAGEFSKSLIIWLAVSFCNLPAVLFARIIRIQRFVFFYDIALLLARTGMLVLGGLFLNLYTTVFLFACIGAAMNIFLIYRVGLAVLRKEGFSTIRQIHNLFKAF